MRSKLLHLDSHYGLRPSLPRFAWGDFAFVFMKMPRIAPDPRLPLLYLQMPRLETLPFARCMHANPREWRDRKRCVCTRSSRGCAVLFECDREGRCLGGCRCLCSFAISGVAYYFIFARRMFAPPGGALMLTHECTSRSGHHTLTCAPSATRAHRDPL